MSFNGSGTYVLPGAALVDGQTISATEHNTLRNDMATALTTCVTRDGQSPATANIPMGNFKHTDLGSGTDRTESVNLGQVQDGTLNWIAAGGTADVITATYSPALTALVDGQLCFIKASAANATTTPTFSPNGLTARTIVQMGGLALVAGSIRGAGHNLILRYDLANTRWELLNPAAGSTLQDFSAKILTVADTITGDFSNATVANQVALQTSTTNGTTAFNVIPNGTATTSSIRAFNNSDPTNASAGSIVVTSTEARLTSGITGTGTYLPWHFYTNNTKQAEMPVAGGFLITQAAGLGYGTGAGGTVTQTTSKTTAVTLNKPTGTVTMHNAALAAGATVQFIINNTLAAFGDTATVSRGNGGSNSAYRIEVETVGTQQIIVNVTNVTGGSLSEAVPVVFNLHKGASA